MKLKLIIAITVLCLVENAYSAINWQGNPIWAMMCDFRGNDFASAQIRGEECSSRCQATPSCTHFVWTTYNGGTCWMKRGVVTRADAIETTDPTMVCGITIEGGSTLIKGPLLWSDEFDSIDISNQNWEQETGGHGWGNNELQYYTNNNANIRVNGNLVIQARREQYGLNRFTSARLISKRKFKYGIYEMRAKLPFGRGTWPAFWLLAANRPLNWPDDGEIDIMEHVGYDMNTVHATIHCKTHNHLIGTQVGVATYVPDVQNTYHTYQLEWTPTSIKAYRDNIFYFRYDKPANANYQNWPFDNEFNIILNLAVGGDWGGAMGIDETIWPQDYTIDYVRYFALP